MNVLGLDLSLRTGWCVGAPGSVPEVGAWDIAAAGRGIGQRMGAFARHLEPLLARVGAVAYERPMNLRGGQAVAVCGQLVGVMSLLCERHGLTPIPVAPQTAKKAATGDGRASKVAVLQAARRGGVNAAGFDESDAWAVWLVGRKRKEGG